MPLAQFWSWFDMVWTMLWLLLDSTTRIQAASLRQSRERSETLHQPLLLPNNNRPVIGVFAQRTNTVPEQRLLQNNHPFASYALFIPASYVNWIGQAGARVYPILMGQTQAYYEEAFRKTNGLLFAGGNQNIFPGTLYWDEGKFLWQLAKEANDRGDYYPIHGTCLGFEEMSLLATHNASVLATGLQAQNLPLPLDMVPGGFRSDFIRGLPASTVVAMSTQNITFNSHKKALLVSEYYSNPTLHSFFQLISTNKAPMAPTTKENGEVEMVEFVSTMQAYHYPFYGTQWHPEKNNFEWSQNRQEYSKIPHTSSAVVLSQSVANFFVSEARKSKHIFPEEERDALIYSAPLVYTGADSRMYEQVYVFCNVSMPLHECINSSNKIPLVQQ